MVTNIRIACMSEARNRVELIKAALAQLRHLGGVGCVVLGEPAYYDRFGFSSS